MTDDLKPGDTVRFTHNFPSSRPPAYKGDLGTVENRRLIDRSVVLVALANGTGTLLVSKSHLELAQPEQPAQPVAKMLPLTALRKLARIIDRYPLTKTHKAETDELVALLWEHLQLGDNQGVQHGNFNKQENTFH